MAKGASSAKQGRSLRWFLVAFFRIEIELFERLQFNNIFLHMKDNEVWRKKTINMLLYVPFKSTILGKDVRL